MRRNTLSLLLLSALLAAAPVASADDFKELIEQGEYEALADKLEGYLVQDKYDDALKTYVQYNLQYLRRGAKPKVPGSEIILVRGAKNDRLYQMPNADGRKKKDDYADLFNEGDTYPSGGPRLMLPNRIRYARRSWDDRLPLIDQYFKDATSDMGANGGALRELEKIIEHHKGGGLGIHANSTASTLISTSTKPLWAFGPPYYIMKVAPERCIFNYKGLSGEFEVLLPFWILPHEIVARCDSREEVENHPLFKDDNPYKDLEFYDYSSGTYPYTNNWELIERNIRDGRPPLPINPTGIQTLTGKVEVSGSKVKVATANGTFEVEPASVASELKTFEGMTVRLRGTVEDGDLSVDEVLSPEERTLTGEVSVSGGEVHLYTNTGDYMTATGSITRAFQDAQGDLVKVDGWVFTSDSGSPEHIYVTAAYATARAAIKLRGNGTVPVGDEVRISYVSTTGKSAIVKHANGWGWTRVSKLDLSAPQPAGATGLAGNLGD